MGNQESSVLFSLNELMNMEQERIQKESDAKRQAEEAALQARLAEEQRAREEEDRRQREAAEAQRQAELRAREEAARLAAIHQGEVEKARLDAENRARMEQLQRQQEHERQLHSLSQDKQKKKLLAIAISIGAVFVLSAIGAVYVINKKNNEAAAYQAQMQTLTADLDKAKEALGRAKTPEEFAKAQADLAEAQKRINDISDHPPTDVKGTGGSKPAVKAGGGGGSKPAATSKCNCDPHDPLCGCL